MEKTTSKSPNLAGGRQSQFPLGKAIMLALAGIFAAIVIAGLALMAFSALSGQGGSIGKIGKGCIGIVEVKGEIVADGIPDSLLEEGTLGSEQISELILDAGARDDVKAILLYVDSPGGSVVASREIYDALMEVDKPKVAYFREVAASGGYYVAMGTDYIVSDPDALTGSIGVRATFLDLSSLLGKIGVNETTIKSGELKDIGSPTRQMTQKEKEVMQALIDEIFSEFKDVVVKSRGSRLDAAKFEEALDARVLSGRQALKAGLVDEVGNKKAAIRKASELAGAKEDLPICEISERKKSLFSKLVSELVGPIVPSVRKGWSVSFS